MAADDASIRMKVCPKEPRPRNTSARLAAIQATPTTILVTVMFLRQPSLFRPSGPT